MIEIPSLTRLGLLLVRPGMLVIATPVLGSGFAPALTKIGLIGAVALLLWPVVELPATQGNGALVLMVARESIIGLALAMAIRVLVAGAELGGQLVGFQIGLAYASLVDPQTGARNSVMSGLYASFTMLVCFGLDAHHMILRALAESYDALPVGLGRIDQEAGVIVPAMWGMVFVLGAQLAAPVVIVLLVVEVALGLLSRIAAMLNILMLGFGLRALIGMVVLAGTIGIVPGLIRNVLGRAFDLSAGLAAAIR